MAMKGGEKAQLINITHNNSMTTNNGEQPSANSHCHVPDEKFDYGARNRLILVLILCFIFMIIEIIGKILYSEFNTKKNNRFGLFRWCSFEFNGSCN
jgi:hypothetical protein